MIELAPTHKYGLALPTPVMPAAGVFGYGDVYRDLLDAGVLGALVTNPISLRPRSVAQGQRILTRGEQVLIHTGLPNAGVKAILHQYGKYWERAPVPVIPHLVATTPAETSKAAVLLSAAPGVGGIELGLAENVSEDKAGGLLHAAQDSGLPIIVQIPFSRVDALAPRLVEAGADALTLTAPPRAVLPLPAASEDKSDSGMRLMRGRLYGPAVFPQLLNVLARFAAPGAHQLHVPIIACGGITSPADALACVSLGAAAVQVDVQVWRTPDVLREIAAAFAALD